MYDKSQDNFSTALLTKVATVVGVQWKEKKTGYRSVVVSTRRRLPNPKIAHFESQPQHALFPRHTFYKSHGQAKLDCHKEVPIAPECRFSTSLPCDHV
jgi:hypothetical protein